jgi:hypothetical protein
MQVDDARATRLSWSSVMSHSTSRRPVTHACHIEEICFRPEREEQMVELELTPDITNARHARNLSRARVDGVDLGFDDLVSQEV